MVQLHSAIVFVALVYSSWAMGASEERCIYYYTGCESAEVYSDIEVSISGITRFAEENDIRLVAEDKSKKCGYLLVFGDKTRYIRSAMTDVDLLLLSKEFFGLDGEENNASKKQLQHEQDKESSAKQRCPKN